MNDVICINQKTVEENKKKYLNLYKGNKKIVVTAEWPADYSVGQAQALENAEDEFRNQVANYNRKCRAVQEGYDNVPCVLLDFGGTAWLIALAYGCRLIKINGLINAEPLYRDVIEAKKFRKIENIYNYGLYPIITERIMEFQKRWGEIPVTICDNQSPIDVITSIIHNEEAMLAMYDEKEIIHDMLNIVTDSIIEINRYLEKTIKNFAGFKENDYLPYGVHISDDDAAFLSPDFYREFAVPYNERLSEEFGGLALHCCMGHAHNLKNMSSIKGFTGFDAPPDYNPVDKVLSALDTKNGVWHVFNYPFAVRNDRKENDEEWFKNIINVTAGKFGLILSVYGETKDKALNLAEKVKSYALKAGRI